MKINKNSWHYKMWTRSFDAYDYPTSTDLCRYCHRVFWRLVAWTLLIIMGVSATGGFVYGILYMGLFQNTMLTLIITAVIAGGIAIVYVYNKWLEGNKAFEEPTSLPGKYFAASKQKVCPLIEFEE